MRVNDTKDWASALPDLVDAYNDTKHSTTKIAPNDVNNSNIGKSNPDELLEKDFLASQLLINRGSTYYFELLENLNKHKQAMLTITKLFDPTKSTNLEKLGFQLKI